MRMMKMRTSYNESVVKTFCMWICCNYDPDTKRVSCDWECVHDLCSDDEKRVLEEHNLVVRH